MSKRKNLIIISAIVLLIVITVLSLMPPKNGIELPKNDKLSHFLAYAVLTLNACLCVIHKKQLRWVLPLIICYGIFIEFMQGFVPGRNSSFLDILANSAGVAIGTGLYFLIGDWIHKLFDSN